jgi:hypothetical protein
VRWGSPWLLDAVSGLRDAPMAPVSGCRDEDWHGLQHFQCHPFHPPPTATLASVSPTARTELTASRAPATFGLGWRYFQAIPGIDVRELRGNPGVAVFPGQNVAWWAVGHAYISPCRTGQVGSTVTPASPTDWTGNGYQSLGRQ